MSEWLESYSTEWEQYFGGGLQSHSLDWYHQKWTVNNTITAVINTMQKNTLYCSTAQKFTLVESPRLITVLQTRWALELASAHNPGYCSGCVCVVVCVCVISYNCRGGDADITLCVCRVQIYGVDTCRCLVAFGSRVRLKVQLGLVLLQLTYRITLRTTNSGSMLWARTFDHSLINFTAMLSLDGKGAHQPVLHLLLFVLWLPLTVLSTEAILMQFTAIIRFLLINKGNLSFGFC